MSTATKPTPQRKVISSIIGLPDENGQVAESFLHTEVIPLEHGKRQVVRVSDVEYDHSQDEWVATLRDGKEIARHKSRARVLEMEREVIDKMLLDGEPIPEGFKL